MAAAVTVATPGVARPFDTVAPGTEAASGGVAAPAVEGVTAVVPAATSATAAARVSACRGMLSEPARWRTLPASLLRLGKENRGCTHANALPGLPWRCACRDSPAAASRGPDVFRPPPSKPAHQLTKCRFGEVPAVPSDA